MKTTPRQQEQASVLVVTIILLAIIGTALASYLMLSSVQAKTVARSQRWNSALDVAEAGIEDALQQMNTSPNDFTANGWGGGGGGIFGPRNIALSTGNYIVTIQTNLETAIYATGYVAAPFNGGQLARAVKITTTKMPLFN